jgi:hypothetical protein
LGVAGCSLSGGLLDVKYFGEYKSTYSPLYINQLEESKLAYVKSANHLIIVAVDGTKVTPFYEVTVGQGIDSIKIEEGYHAIKGFLGVDIKIGRVYLKAQHEYFIDYIRKPGDYGRTKIYYWVKDLTDNKIVYREELNRLNKNRAECWV